jgi:hypothetical protein
MELSSIAFERQVAEIADRRPELLVITNLDQVLNIRK